MTSDKSTESCHNDGDSSTEQPTREISSEQLLGEHREILIRHGEDVYRLRLTRNGKLILQK